MTATRISRKYNVKCQDSFLDTCMTRGRIWHLICGSSGDDQMESHAFVRLHKTCRTIANA